MACRPEKLFLISKAAENNRKSDFVKYFSEICNLEIRSKSLTTIDNN